MRPPRVLTPVLRVARVPASSLNVPRLINLMIFFFQVIKWEKEEHFGCYPMFSAIVAT